MAALLDVNALIALVDSDHVGHEAMHRWFRKHANQGWATCPLTENGMVRVLSQAAYPSGQRAPDDVVSLVKALKSAFAESHQFWADDVSLTDESLFRAGRIIGAKLVTDVYLLGLAAHHNGTLVSLDRSLPWQAIQGGSASLVQTPE